MPAWLGWIAVVLLSLYLAVYPALATGLAWRLGGRRPLALVLALAGGWAVTEWLRASSSPALPGTRSARRWCRHPLRDIAPLIGTYGLSRAGRPARRRAVAGVQRDWKPPAGDRRSRR